MWDETGVLNAMAGRGACGAFSAEQTALPVIGEAFSAEQVACLSSIAIKSRMDWLRMAFSKPEMELFRSFGLNLVVLIPSCVD